MHLHRRQNREKYWSLLEEDSRELLLKCWVQLNSAVVGQWERSKEDHQTECGMLDFIKKYKQDYQKIRKEHKEVFGIPFSSKRMRMTTSIIYFIKL